MGILWKNIWYFLIYYVPFNILSVSILQIIFYIYSTPILNEYVRFEPNKRLEWWRYVTYMLVHGDRSHLVENVLMQCIIATLLGEKQDRLRVFDIYILGGITGVLGAACIRPDIVIGASAGGYALLLSDAVNVIMNYKKLKFKILHFIWTVASVTIALGVIIRDIVHVPLKEEPQVLWQAHFVGGLTGLFLGLVIFRCHSTKTTRTRKILFSVGLCLYSVLVIGFIIVTLQIKKCTPNDAIQYVYWC